MDWRKWCCLWLLTSSASIWAEDAVTEPQALTPESAVAPEPVVETASPAVSEAAPISEPVAIESKPAVIKPTVAKPKASKVTSKRLTKKERLAKKKVQEENLAQLISYAEDGNYKEGYELASAMLDDSEGQDKFDFYYGLHALETGRVDEASFAFERLTLLYPSVLRYRLELARALFLNNNLDSAKNEFEAALSTRPPKNVQTNIRGFLARIKAAQRGAMHRFNGGLGFSAGYDSNINSATEEKGVTFPDLGFITLQDEARSLGSAFTSLNTQFNYQFSPKNTHNLDVGFQSNHKRNSELSTYDLDVINGFAGYSWQPGRVRLQGGLNINTVMLDGEDYQQQTGVSGTALFTTLKKTSYGLNLNVASRESKNENLPDADVVLIALNMGWVKPTELNNVSLYSNNENVSDETLKHFGKTSFGASYNNRLLKSARFSRVMQLSLQSSSFQAETPVFNKKRSDTSIMASWGYEWKPWKYLSWHGEASLNHNASNLDLYTYYRAIISTGIKVSF